MFSITTVKKANTIVHQETIQKVKKKHVEFLS